MTASAATAALTAPPSTATFGLPATDTHLIAKLRNMPADLRDSILGARKESK